MANRAGDWMRQAEKDLAHAQRSHDAGDFEWSCFAAHQAAEKSLKAAHAHHGQVMWGHVLSELLTQLPPSVEQPQPIDVEYARVLDGYYLPTRYPDGHVAGAPFEHYGPLQSEQALKYAGVFLEFARRALAGPRRS